MTKSKKLLRKHASQRALQHYGLSLSKNDLDSMASQIRKQKSIFVKRSSNRVTLHIVEVKEKWLPVVYDKQRGCIVTVLPKHVLQQWATFPNVAETLQSPA